MAANELSKWKDKCDMIVDASQNKIVDDVLEMNRSCRRTRDLPPDGAAITTFTPREQSKGVA